MLEGASEPCGLLPLRIRARSWRPPRDGPQWRVKHNKKIPLYCFRASTKQRRNLSQRGVAFPSTRPHRRSPCRSPTTAGTSVPCGGEPRRAQTRARACTRLVLAGLWFIAPNAGLSAVPSASWSSPGWEARCHVWDINHVELVDLESLSVSGMPIVVPSSRDATDPSAVQPRCEGAQGTITFFPPPLACRAGGQASGLHCQPLFSLAFPGGVSSSLCPLGEKRREGQVRQLTSPLSRGSEHGGRMVSAGWSFLGNPN